MSKDPPAAPQLKSIEELLFNEPLYAEYSITRQQASVLYGRAEKNSQHYTPTADSFCPECKQVATFEIRGASIPGGDPWNKIQTRHTFDTAKVVCTRNRSHAIFYFIYIRFMTVMKVGQWPSLATIANDEARYKYRRVLRGENWSELYKAVGLAAHGEGIGSFVYLRRVFERLIQSRFDKHKEEKGWDPQDFATLRMDNKIDFLKDYLPTSLVEMRRIYGIFSKGIHELQNNQCLAFYEAGREAIIMILDDDLRALEEQDRRKAIADAVAKFDPTAVPSEYDVSQDEK